MRSRFMQTIIFAALAAAMLTGLANTPADRLVSTSAAAEIRPGTPAPSATGAPYALTGYKWVGRTSLNVYSNWDGGSCLLDATDFSGPASASVNPAVAAQLLQASINDVNARLAGALVLVNAGSVTHTDLCDDKTSEPIVVGWGTIKQTGLTMNYGTSYASAPGAITFQFARVLISNAYDFACPDGPAYRDLQHTLTHELLHAIGVDHSQDPAAIMAATSYACQAEYLLQPEDVAALAALYPPPAVPVIAPVVTPPTALPVVASTTTASFDRAPASSGITPLLWNGGSVAQLATATLNAKGASVTIFVNGSARVLIPGAPAFVNAPFAAAFPQGVPAGAIVLILAA